MAGPDADDWPLDILDAESEGMLGYLISEALQAALPDARIVSLLTRVVVSRDDPAFRRPDKPIGSSFDRARAEILARELGWRVAPVSPDGSRYRRVVASPEPLGILESEAIALLVDAGALVVCAGGGGIPVAISTGGTPSGVEAVIDKDLTSALLAETLHADALLLLTNVDAAYRDWGTDRAVAIGETTVDALHTIPFAAGSMKPKVDAACRFVSAGGRFAAIGRLEDAQSLLAGTCGTRLHGDGRHTAARQMAALLRP